MKRHNLMYTWIIILCIAIYFGWSLYIKNSEQQYIRQSYNFLSLVCFIIFSGLLIWNIIKQLKVTEIRLFISSIVLLMLCNISLFSFVCLSINGNRDYVEVIDIFNIIILFIGSNIYKANKNNGERYWITYYIVTYMAVVLIALALGVLSSI